MGTNAKNHILETIRKALAQQTPKPFDGNTSLDTLYHPPEEDLAIAFAEKFVSLQGQFVYCLNNAELKTRVMELCGARHWTKIYCADAALRSLFPITFSDDLAGADAAITGCEALVARTGSIVLSAAQAMGRTASVYAPVHICVAHSRQLCADISDTLARLQEKYNGNIPSMISFASGPSRTADIEKTLVTGVHGPKEVFCFLSDA